MRHADSTATAPHVTPAAPTGVTVALATRAGGLRAHHRRAGRLGGLGHPAAPTVTATPGTRPRADESPGRAGTEARAAARHRPAGAEDLARLIDPHLGDRAGGREQADQRSWTGQGPS